MPKSPTYTVKILRDGLCDDAYLSEASNSDIGEISLSQDFQCDWSRLWENTDFNCEAIVKLVYQGKIQGIIKFAFYPHPAPDGVPQFTEILNIECLPRQGRITSPVGLWLIWYAVKMCFEFGCSGDSSNSILILTSVEPAIQYYKDKVKMEALQWTTLSPSEAGYAFRFSKSQAIEFLTRIESKYGEAIELSE
jgi:hypothetical protein